MTSKYSIYDIIRRFCKKSGLLYSTITLNSDTKPIGAIQTISYSIKPNSINIQACRVRLDRTRVSDVFSNSSIISHNQIRPLQIEIDDGFDIVNIKNAWICSVLGYSYTSNDYIIVDGLDLQAESINIKNA